MKKENRISALDRVARFVMLCLFFMRPLRAIGFSGLLLCMVAFIESPLAVPVQAAVPEYTIEDLGEWDNVISGPLLNNEGVVIFSGSINGIEGYYILRNGKVTPCNLPEQFYLKKYSGDGRIIVYDPGISNSIVVDDYGRSTVQMPVDDFYIRPTPIELNEAGQVLAETHTTQDFVVVDSDGSSHVVKYSYMKDAGYYYQNEADFDKSVTDFNKPFMCITYDNTLLDFNDAGQVFGVEYKCIQYFRKNHRPSPFQFSLMHFWVWDREKGFCNLDLGEYVDGFVFRNYFYTRRLDYFTSNGSILLPLFPPQNRHNSSHILYDIQSGRISKIKPTVLTQPQLSKMGLVSAEPEFHTDFHCANDKGVILGTLNLNNTPAILGEAFPFCIPVVYLAGQERPRPLQELITDDRGWQLWSALDINDHGQILGSGILDGKLHLYLLNPTDARKPEYKSPPFLALEAAVTRASPSPVCL
ncbi:hypothetical protein SCALIN_C27_0131 [Candidatus Scalindua japonica]|uniref:Uncharacterized protein n=2 Tax=Candidatus Scalindua japonica TaxID=1284222 RepID=A0A286U0U8_9BACT|nr:hypothetical protein SCALIN_C27_0131 [Candidatus Scalindua japonica]